MYCMSYPDGTKLTSGVSIGDLYSALQMAASTRLQVNRGYLWRQDVESMGDDQWTQALEDVTQVSLSPSQKLTQLFILHWVHYCMCHRSCIPGGGRYLLTFPDVLIPQVLLLIFYGDAPNFTVIGHPFSIYLTVFALRGYIYNHS